MRLALSKKFFLQKKIEAKKELIPNEKLNKKQLHEIIKDLESQMEIAAKNLEFEQAAILRDQIKKLRKTKYLH